MISNYKLDSAGSAQEELQLIKTSGSYNTWRVYFDIVEDEEKRKSEVVDMPKTTTEIVYEDDSEGNKIPVEVTKTTTETVTLETRVFNSKYIEVRKHISEEVTALSLMKEEIINEITEYDTSNNVNCFLLNGEKTWLDKDTRVGLMNSTNIQKSAGLNTTVLWLGTTALTINCDTAIQLLNNLEIYALACFNKTAEHKKSVEDLATVNDVVSYDYTAGYPDKLVITV